MVEPVAVSACEPELYALARQALTYWPGHFGDPVLVKFRENAVFSVHDAQGRRFALRLHRQGYHSAAALESELVWIRALADHGLQVPAPVPALNGIYSVPIPAKADQQVRYADILLWLNGQTLTMAEDAAQANTEALGTIYRSLGAEAARMHDHGQNWSPPARFSRASWNREGLVGETPLWGRFWEFDALSRAERALAVAARSALAEDLGELPMNPSVYGLIHGDLLSDNVMIDAGRIQLIDFDDAGWGWHMFELATALYFHIGSPNFNLRQEALLHGYRQVRPLSDEQQAQLPLFLLARGVTYLGWLHTRRETQTAREQAPMLVGRF